MAKTALILDDSVTARRMIAGTLLGAGYNVLEAGHGAGGIAQLDANPVDVIITDLTMPVMGGIDFIRADRHRPATRVTPVLMLTTETNEARKQEGRAAGCTGWIVKPVMPATLLQIMACVCP
ncbi:MAG: response regulator [Myxococcales bacterium]|nr:response regulator [Myxococcales bacterium]